MAAIQHIQPLGLFRTRKSLSTLNQDKLLAATESAQFYLREQIRFYNDTADSDFELVNLIKLPEIKDFGQYWLYANRIGTFYQNTANGIKVWNFEASNLSIDNKNDSQYNRSERFKFILGDNNLHYTRDSIARELKLISISTQGLKVCEFNEGSSCSPGAEFFLSNRNPAEVTLKAIGPGRIIPVISDIPTLTPYAYIFGNKVRYEVIPDKDSTSIIKSVSGCGGQVDNSHGFIYTSAEIRESCTITAIFTIMPATATK